MTAFKKYCKSKGWTTEEDYPCMPHQERGSNIVIEAIRFNAEDASIVTEMNIGTQTIWMGRDGEPIDVDFD